MSDLAPEVVAEAPEVFEAAPEVEAPVVDAPVVDEGDPFDNEETTQFDRAYVERLRREAAEHRTKAKTFHESFDGYQPEEVDVLLDLVRELNADPKSAAGRLEALVESIREAYPDEVAAEETAPEYLTRADLERIEAEKQEAKAQEDAVAAIETQAKEFGYEKGTADYFRLLWTAQNVTGADLAKAHESIQAERQAIIDNYLKSKADDADALPGGSGSGGAGTVPPEAGGFDAADRRLKERLKDL
jgi:DivIVA domain-containing protein